MYEAWANNWSHCQRPSLTSSHGWHHYGPFIFPPTAALLPAPVIGPCFSSFLCLVHFFFVIPSFLPFQKVMHTRKRHSELYHELNHSSKFHTIDRYSRDPAMSTFKVRPLPQKLRNCGTLYSVDSLPFHLPLPPPPPTTFKSPLAFCCTCSQECLSQTLTLGNIESALRWLPLFRKSQTKRTMPVD